MKHTLPFASLLLFVFLLASCKKSGTAITPPNVQPKCRLESETTNLSGNTATYEYAYDTDGNVSTIKKFNGGYYHVLHDSVVMSDISKASYNLIDWPYPSALMQYNAPFAFYPSQSRFSFTENGITKVDVYTYFYFYDAKNRLVTVGEQTDFVAGDLEYDLHIVYDDDDNVTSLNYEITTGQANLITYTATGYDTHPTPYAGIPNWPFLMDAAWNNYDPEPLFTALSKHNPLGFLSPDGFKREMSYTYNSDGYPVVRSNTNITASGTYSFDQTFSYTCR